MPPTMPPPPDVDAASAVPDVNKTTKERVLGGIGGALSAGVGEDESASPLAREMARQHDIRLANARRHYENATTYGGVLGTGEIDPDTGEPTGTDPNTGKPLTPDQRAQYKQMLDGAWGDYEKAAGVSKEAKGALQNHKSILDLLVTKGHGALKTVMDAHKGLTGAAQKAGIAPPPAPGGDASGEGAPTAGAAPAGGAGANASAASAIPPPPAPSPPAYNPQSAAQAPALRQGMADNRAVALHQRIADIDSAAKQEEEKAKAGAKNKHLQHVPVTDPKTGKTVPGSYDPSSGEYLDQQGNIIENAQLAAKQFVYKGPDDTPLTGWAIGDTLYDQDMKPLPSGTEKFVAWMQPRTTTSEGFKEVTQPDGSTKLVPVETSSTTTRGGAGGAGGTGKGKESTAPATPPPAKIKGSGTTVGGKVPAGVSKSYEAYNGAQERFAVMQDALPRALQGDQQAMLNLLANHVGMTMGLQKGARITQGVYSEAEGSAPWLARVDARFDKDGYLTGVVLTPEQMKQMIDLAKVRLDQDKAAWQREIGSAKEGYGMTPPPGSKSKKKGPPPKTAGEYLDSLGVPH
jgi:hypothetical protein